MATRKPASSVRLAILACLSRCTQSHTPITSLADVAELLRHRGWDAASIRQVEQGALRLLASQRELEARASEALRQWPFRKPRPRLGLMRSHDSCRLHRSPLR